MEPKKLMLAMLACLTIASGARAQEYEWSITYPPADSSKYGYIFQGVDSWGEVCAAVGRKRLIVNSAETGTLMCFRSTDGGQTWTEQNPGLELEHNDLQPQLRQVQQIDSLNAIAYGDSGLFIKTTDGGQTWLNESFPTQGQIFDAHFSDSLTGIIVKNWGYTSTDTSNILITHDGGATWIPSKFCPWLAATMCHSDGGESFRAIGYAEGPIYHTDDDWQAIDSSAWIVPLQDDTDVFSQCNFKGTDTLVGSGSSDLGKKLYLHISTDGGTTWSNPDVPDTPIQYSCNMSSLDRGIVFYGVFYGGNSSSNRILVSRDHGMTWDIENYLFNKLDTVPGYVMSLAVTQENEGIAVFAYDNLKANPSFLAHGVPITDVVSVPTTGSNMFSIYPNPATQTVTISPLGAGTEIDILDPLGRYYPVRKNGNILDVSSLSAGVYYVRSGTNRATFVKE